MKERFVQITENIWLFPHDPNPHKVQSAVGLIIDGDETVLVDTGNSPRLAPQIKEELKRRQLPPVSRIIYTHHHWDHIFGACEFQVPVVAHTLCRDILLQEAEKPWSSDYLMQEIEGNPRLKIRNKARDRAIEDWDTFRIVVPDTVFDSTLRIVLNQVTLELEHVGGEHAEDSIIVKVPEARTIFLGDCYYPPPLHLRTSKPEPDVTMLASVENADYDLYIEGHDDPFTRAELLEFLEG